MIQTIYVLGDVHGNTTKVGQVLEAIPWTPNDVLLMVGDLGVDTGPRTHKTVEDQVQSVKDLLSLVKQYVSHDRMAWVPGNHDHAQALETLPGNTDGRLTTMPSGLRVWGVGGATGKFGFPNEPDHFQMRRALAKVPAVDVLLTHQPPGASPLARCARGADGGSRAIRTFLEEKFWGRLMACGHIHEAFGVDHIWGSGWGEIVVVNAGSFGNPYPAMRYGQVEFDLDERVVVEAKIVNVK